MKTTRISLSAIVAVLAFLSATQTSNGQVVPFKASGDMALYSPDTAVTTAIGKATHMGKTIGFGIAFPSADLGNGLYEWTATDYVLTAANGDKLRLYGGGLLQFIPLDSGKFSAVWLGEFHVAGGTGKFANVSAANEPIEVIAVNDPFVLDEFGNPIPGDTWTYSWELNGEINLGKKKGKK